MTNENGNEKKGFFARLVENKKAKKTSCCCNLELEEVPEENNKSTADHSAKAKDTDSCCK